MRLVKKCEGGSKVERLTDGPLDRQELKVRQAWAENKFRTKGTSNKGALGFWQIMPITLQEFNNKTGANYTLDDLEDINKSTIVRNFIFDQGEYNSKFNPTLSGDSVRYAKGLAAYNMGSNKLKKRLSAAEEKGVDTLDGWSWLDYLPKETRDYINFILRGLTTDYYNNTAYEKAKSRNSGTVKLLKSIKKLRP